MPSTIQSTQTALGAFYRRLAARTGKAKAVTATARKLANLFYNDWFDVTQELRLNFDEHGLNAAMTERVTWLIEYAQPATCDVKHPYFGPLIGSAMRRAPKARRRITSEISPPSQAV